MKNIVAINTANTGGGAENVGYRLAKELHERGYHSRLLVRRIDYGADPLAREIVVPVPGSRTVFECGTAVDAVCSTHSLFYLSTLGVPRMPIVQHADVIHMHNMHGYYFNMFAIPYLMGRKPVVWTFHDMWPITGKCVWAFDCDGFTKKCGSCPRLSDYPAARRDTSRFTLRLKKALYGKKAFVIVTPSAWLQAQVQRSILKDVPCVVIPSPVDTRVFRPGDKREIRERLGIPPDKKVVMFVASWINSIQHKGIDAFTEMLRGLVARRPDIFALVVGHLEGKSVIGEQFSGKETGWVQDPEMLQLYYAAADVFVSPTMAENSSCTIMEAMASGTAVVAYATGGVPEQIVHGETGFLIEPGNRRSLTESVLALLADGEKAAAFGRSSATRALANYSLDVFVRKYLDAYAEAIALRVS